MPCFSKSSWKTRLLSSSYVRGCSNWTPWSGASVKKPWWWGSSLAMSSTGVPRRLPGSSAQEPSALQRPRESSKVITYSISHHFVALEYHAAISTRRERRLHGAKRQYPRMFLFPSRLRRQCRANHFESIILHWLCLLCKMTLLLALCGVSNLLFLTIHFLRFW